MYCFLFRPSLNSHSPNVIKYSPNKTEIIGSTIITPKPRTRTPPFFDSPQWLCIFNNKGVFPFFEIPYWINALVSYK